ncbi:helix-turn-helix transcriptional regulator [Saccharothrix deserti]|uniref:helix-turn-helix transcriptional regulator n=1 Tax=Saccharothrix deserti TaxID=2593674 RepID=UPI00131AF03F|nr:LuxR family transcriptional regulator [Saccharothrix deserti]
MNHDEAEVTGGGHTAEPFRITGPDRSARGRFVGRFWELLLVDHVLSELQNGHGGVLLVTGRAGIGKTRIVAELVARAQTGSGCVSVAVEAGGAAHPGLWRQVLAELARDHPDVTGRDLSTVDALTLRTAASEITERARVPMIVVLEGIDAVDSDELSIMDDLLPDLGDVPLLLVLTATTQRDDTPTPRHPHWHGHRNTTRLDLRPLPAETVLELVEAELPGVSRETVMSIAAASDGNPGIAQELCEWTLHPREDADVSTTAWLTAALADTDDVLATLAAVGEPVVAGLIGEVLRMDRDGVVAVLEAAVATGLVVRDHEVDPRYLLSHPLIGYAARALAGPERMAVINRRIAHELADRQEESPSPVHVRIAAHLLAAGDHGPGVVRHCLDAVRWLIAERSFGAAIDFATEGLARDPDPEQESHLLMLAGRCAIKSGAYSVGLAYLERAIATTEAMADRELFARAVVEFLEATLIGQITVERRPELLVRALRGCPPGAVALRARLEAQRASMTCLDDAPGYRVIAEHAVALARESGDPEAIGFALAVRAANPIPHEVEEYARIAAETSRLPGAAAWGALPAMVYSAMATGRRETLDTAMNTAAGLPAAPGDRFIHTRHAEFAAGRAILDAEEADLVHALRRLTAEAPSIASFVAPAATGLWRAHTGRALPPAATPPALRPDLPGHITSLVTAVDYLMPAESADPVAHRRLKDLVARLPDPTRLPRDFTWSTWQAVTARVGVLLGDADRCRRAVGQLGSFLDQFVVLGTALPVGPVGWFLADPLSLLGRTEEALDANTRAERISRDLHSRGWVARCLIQRGHLLRGLDPAAAADAAAEARQAAREIGMTSLVEQTGKLLVGIRADIADPAVGPVGHRTDAREPAAGPVNEPGVAGGSAILLAAGLSLEDIDLIQYAAAGNTNAQIAKILHLSVPTIERRLTNVYRRLGVRNRAQAVSLVARGPGR